ncbi:MAG: hypothetical protein AB1630_03145 [bacterium]
MTVIDVVAKGLHIAPKELLRESLKSYLEKKLSRIETDIFLLAKKYGVKDVFDLDSKVKKGFFSEKESYEDYFLFDNLEAECERIKRLIGKVNV